MPAPSAPTDFTLAAQGFSLRPGKIGSRSTYNRGAIRLTFTAVTATAFHTVQMKAGSGSWADVAQAPAGVNSVEVLGLTPNTNTYRFQIRAENSAGEVSAWVPLNAGNTIPIPAVATQAAQMNPPSGFGAVADAREVVFSWTDNANNESGYEIVLEDPSQAIGSPGRSITLSIGFATIYAQGTEQSLYPSYTYPIGDNSWMKHGKTYRAQIRAAGGARSTTGNTLFTDFSAEYEFTTPAPALGITNNPRTIRAFKGQPLDYQILTNGPATDYQVTAGTLPTGVSLNGATGLISGVPTIAGSSSVTLFADNGSTDDSRVFTVQLNESQVFAPAVSPSAWVTSTFTLAVVATVTNPDGPGTRPFTPFRHIVTGDVTNGSATISNVVTAKLAVGMKIDHAAFPAGTTVSAIGVNTVAASANATSTVGGATITFMNAGSYAVDGGALPDGLTLDADTGVISGVPTVVGVFSSFIAVKLKHGNTVVASTRARYDINVLRPAVLVEVDTGLGFAQPEQLGTVSVPFADEVTWNVRGVGFGPVGSLANPTVTIDNAPSWLSAVGATLTGTVSEVGSWDVSVTVSNGTYEGTGVLRLLVKALEITSPATLEVYQGQSFSFTPTTRPSGAAFSIAGALPTGVEFETELAGVAEEAGDFPMVLTATVGTQTDTQNFLLKVVPIFRTISDTIEAWEDEPVHQPVEFLGDGAVEQWALSGAPNGITITPVSGYEPTPGKATIGGSPANGTAGIYDMTIIATVIRGQVHEIHRKTVTVTVSGGLFLGWFHDNPHLLDLQVFPRTREVKSYYGSETTLLWVKRGDSQALHVIFRDRRTTILPPTDFAEVFLTVRPRDNFDAEPYLTAGGAVGTAVPIVAVGSKNVMKLALEVTGSAMEQAFDSLNLSPGEDPNSARLEAHLEITYKLVTGERHTTRIYGVTIAQDLDR